MEKQYTIRGCKNAKIEWVKTWETGSMFIQRMLKMTNNPKEAYYCPIDEARQLVKILKDEGYYNISIEPATNVKIDEKKENEIDLDDED